MISEIWEVVIFIFYKIMKIVKFLTTHFIFIDIHLDFHTYLFCWNSQSSTFAEK